MQSQFRYWLLNQSENRISVPRFIEILVPKFVVIILTLAYAIAFFNEPFSPTGDVTYYQKFVEALAQGMFDLSMPGFHGADFFVVPYYLVTHSPVATMQVYGIVSIFLPLLAYFAGKTLYGVWEGTLLSLITASDAGLDQNAATTADNKTLVVQWNDTLNAFVSTDGTHLAYDRTPLLTASNGSTPSYWRALEGNDVSKMKMVVWDKDAQVWAQWDIATNTFFKESGYRKIWNSSAQLWSLEQ